MPGFDLHTHSNLSDGTTSIEENVADALRLGLEGLAVTDHDTTDGCAAAAAAADGTSLVIVPGTEFSAELDGWSVHVLGYWIAADDPALTTELARLRDERTDRARRIVERFNELGIDITFDRVRQIAGAAPIGRPHVAQAVVESGAAVSTREVFDRFLADGGPAYVEKHAVHPVRAVELLVGAGGVAVLAHPGLYGARDGVGGITDAVIEELAEVGLAGIEADHPDHDEDQREHYRALARALGLVVTAGSDYHGEAKTNRLGSATTARHDVEALRSRLTTR